MKARELFHRTICGCESCRLPCQHMPGMLGVGDAEAIAKYTGQTVEEMETGSLAASPGARVGILMPFGKLHVYHIHTIVPREKPEGGCVFLRPDGLCAVHPVAPYGCSHFDSHMDRATGDRRSAAAMKEIAGDADYQAMWQRLHDAGHDTVGPELKRERMAQTEKETE